MSSFKNFVLWLYGSLGNTPSIFSYFASTETSITACVALASPLFMHLTIRRYARILHPSGFFMSSTKQGRLKISTNLFFILIKTKFDLFYFLFINMDHILSPNGDTKKPKFCLRGSVKLHRLPFENIKLCLFSCCVFFPCIPLVFFMYCFVNYTHQVSHPGFSSLPSPAVNATSVHNFQPTALFIPAVLIYSSPPKLTILFKRSSAKSAC